MSKQREILALGLLALVAGVAPTTAADLAPIFKAPPSVPFAPTWTGFYVGGSIGFGNTSKKFYDNFPTPDGELDAAASPNGWVGGFQAGANYQIKWLVIGVEGDFTWSGMRKNNFGCFPFGDQVCSASPEWFASLTGRVGAAFGPSLLYIKGGPAWVRDTYTDFATCSGTQPKSRAGIPALCGVEFVGSETRPGWSVGVGVEYLLTANWSVKLEYDYMNFGKHSVVLNGGAGNFFTEEISQRVHMVKTGLNYRFGWGEPAPLKAYASDLSRSQSRPVKTGQDESPSNVLLFSGTDFSRRSLSGWVGGLIAPWQDLDTSGLRVWMLGDLGTYKYGAGGNTFKGTYSTGDFMVGYGFEGDNYSMNLLGGFNAASHMVSPIDPDNSVRGTAGGIKVRGDLWVNPTPKTMTYGEAEYSTAFQTYNVSGKLGYDVTNGREIFVGPQVSVLGDERFHQWRVGLHATQLKAGRVQIDLGLGFAHDSVVGNGAYGRVEMSTHF